MLIEINFHQVQASLASNTFAIAGHAENKQITELLPGILNQVSDLYLQPHKARWDIVSCKPKLILTLVIHFKHLSLVGC